MILQLDRVSLKRSGKWILKDIDWKVQQNENWVLYGLNGAGKTALLNMLCSYYFPTSGDMQVLGHEFGKTELGDKLRRKIGLVSAGLQQKLYPADSAFEIALSGAYASIGLYETPSKEIREKAINLLKDLGAISYADRRYETLSQGEKQRALIARALMADPELLILDEPVTGLDFMARENLLDTITYIAGKENAPSILYVTHHAEEILPVFDKALLLKEGEVFAAGDIKEMLSDDLLSSFFDMPIDVLWNNDRPFLTRAEQTTNA
ncbi:ABC transporter ATP-binding protein [Bacillus atrophaeus]|uniref:ABC transporter ATP-binding protein n=1 Tax=Bacillus atrophaeus TaxID=1452 RepID=UPI0022828CE3|nr:ABC transporter ATP-binding protein [Bacillus atrophaeus]MCY8497362.1 ABC transporter ATP-binding protein [Bacillus atrophaeus]MCY8813024.1 ABC transporter ATP-binding protein [Bacillus atrophaeus]MCY8820067.1 ABC transporter ATP-binding protein [Bacillus atrophaeus]MCY8829701.1 ABC transporter ATP-binding protein [Bacillus atrophaeus]MCY8833592.1 ABC transporter ATP-binding protein [Bacillus atrophaeus]